MSQRSSTSRQQRREQGARPTIQPGQRLLSSRRAAPVNRRPTRTARAGPLWQPTALTALALAPLRLFLGVTFVYAGIQKLTDPQFFNPAAVGYIGRQISAFATGSPIRALLLQVALPHALLFGTLVAWGELAIGIGALLGLLLRPAAVFGALLSLLFLLSASWRVFPYFYGSDIVFLFAWLTLVFVGPAAGGWFALDGRLASWIAARIPPQSSERFANLAQVVLGVQPPPAPEAAVVNARHPGRASRSGRYAGSTRRDFLRGAFVGITATMGAALAIAMFGKGNASSAPSTAPTATGGTAGATGSGEAATATTASSGTAIATASQVPVNSSASFTLTANGDPGVLVHLATGSFVAFDATCTHAGCPVQYDPSSKLLLCPCHGAAFDPAHGAQVLQGPTDTPLASVAIHVDNSTGSITLSN